MGGLLMPFETTTPCARCGIDIHPLDVFPESVCIDCHAAAHATDTPDELRRQIFDGFGGY